MSYLTIVEYAVAGAFDTRVIKNVNFISWRAAETGRDEPGGNRGISQPRSGG
jgi:hypothetical protein